MFTEVLNIYDKSVVTDPIKISIEVSKIIFRYYMYLKLLKKTQVLSNTDVGEKNCKGTIPLGVKKQTNRNQILSLANCHWSVYYLFCQFISYIKSV